MDVVVRRYGSATDFVVTFGRGTHRFTLDETLGEFIYVDQVPCLPMHFVSLFHVSTGNPDAAWHSSHNIHHSTHGLHGVHSVVMQSATWISQWLLSFLRCTSLRRTSARRYTQ